MRSLPLAVLLLLPVAAGCGGGDGSGGAAPFQFTSATPLEPTAGTWRTWYLSSPSSLRPPAPPAWDSSQTAAELESLRGRAAIRGPVQTANIDDWNDEGTCAEWMDLLVDLVKSRKPPPPRVARLLGLFSTAMFDAMVASWDAKYAYLRPRPSDFPNPPAVYGPLPECPSYPSERAAMSAAAAVLLRYAFPSDIAVVDAKLLSALDADLDACIRFQSDVDAGVDIGETVGALALARAATDGGDEAQPTYVESGVPGRWARTPQNDGSTPVFPPVLPGWGGVTCWHLPDGGAIRPPAPPAYGSPEWDRARDYVLEVNLTLTPSEAALADLWADGGGTATPPGHWAEIAVDACVLDSLNECRTARVLAYLNTAQCDAFIACWECKYFYDVERPISAIRRDVAGQSAWLPYINTPPFPTYPSGHSSTSGAASTVLAYFFPQDADLYIQWSNDAKDSRLYGGIHFVFDNDVGLSLGRACGTLAILGASTDGAD